MTRRRNRLEMVDEPLHYLFANSVHVRASHMLASSRRCSSIPTGVTLPRARPPRTADRSPSTTQLGCRQTRARCLFSKPMHAQPIRRSRCSFTHEQPGMLAACNHESHDDIRTYIFQELAFGLGGRIIAAPASMQGVDIFAFDPERCEAGPVPQLTRCCHVRALDLEQYTTRCPSAVRHCNTEPRRFSPTSLLLASGGDSGHIHFSEPVL